MPDELSPSAAAKRLGTTTRSVQRWIATGRLPARRVGGRWRVAFDALDAFLAEGAPGGDESNASRAPATVASVFVANRGEIARRIARTAARLGIPVIVPETEGSHAVDLLDIAGVVEAAREAGADAVHPGFGFLAENAGFAEAVIGAGLRWVGPPPSAIRAMGDKAAARRLAHRLGVPTVPGYDGRGQSDRALRDAAEGVGYPLLVKPAAGGGGKGMRTVREPTRFPDALAAARREATQAFGDDRLLLERLVEGARHVEVQVLFDRHGAGIHLGERDCSTQRRHQKVLEETPSPAVTPEVRDALGRHALALASAVGYESAGTCEFLLTDRGEIFFLEMNTRLQVEHPVTELVTGLDLVELQLAIAADAPLGITQAETDSARARGGHAVEVRLYAEDAEAGFLPATGRVEALRWPAGEGIRVDAGIDVGDQIGGRFDPMLAKVIAHGRDRREALERLTRALDETLVLGLVTNLRFLRWLIREPAVLEGQMRTDTLDRIWPPDDWSTRAAFPAEAWSAAAEALAARADPADVWADGWRLNARPSWRLAIADPEPAERSISIPAAQPPVGGSPDVATVVVDRDVAYVDLAGRSVAFRLAAPPDVDRAARAAEAQRTSGGGEVVAPMPGSVIAVHHRAGDRVAAGDPVVTLEAMKMEHVVAALTDGILGDVTVRPGDQVARGQSLATIEPAG